MSGETNLNNLLASMSAILADGAFVFLTTSEQSVPASLTPVMIFQESEGTTYIVERSAAEKAGLSYEYPCRMITLQIHSSLDAVGFIARIATELANANISVNPVSGYFHDHLFVPEGCELQAVDIIERIAQNA